MASKKDAFVDLLGKAAATTKKSGSSGAGELVSRADIDGVARFSGRNQSIELSLIDPSPYQPRITMYPDELESIADSMSSDVGLMSAVIVRRKSDGRYELIDGHRRIEGAKKLGWEEVPADVKDMSDAQAAIAALVTNMQREDFSAYEQGVAMESLMSSGVVKSKSELTTLTGLDRNTVSRCLRMAALPDAVKAVLMQDPRAIGANAGEALFTIAESDEDAAIEALRKVMDGSLKESRIQEWYQAKLKSGSGEVAVLKKPAIIRQDRGLKATIKDMPNGALIVKVSPGKDVDPALLKSAVEKALQEMSLECPN